MTKTRNKIFNVFCGTTIPATIKTKRTTAKTSSMISKMSIVIEFSFLKIIN